MIIKKNITKLTKEQLNRLIENLPHTNEEIENASFDHDKQEFIVFSWFNGDSRREYRTKLSEEKMNKIFAKSKTR